VIFLLISIIKVIFNVYTFLVLARVVMSWATPRQSSFIFRFIYDLTEPALALCRRLLPNALTSPMDFSPVVLIIVLQLVETLLIRAIL
jgi:YggT family protein